MKLFSSDTNAVSPLAMARNTVTVDENKRVSKVSDFVYGETYYITKSEDLVALKDLVNSGKSTANVTFELANDVDMQGTGFGAGVGIGTSSNPFSGVIKGNNHKISNLLVEIECFGETCGFFAYTNGAKIDSVTLENMHVISPDCHDEEGGGFIYSAVDTVINNCAIVGGTITNNHYLVASLVHNISGGAIANCYSLGMTYQNNYDTALIGNATNVSILNCYTTDGCLVSYLSNSNLENCYTSNTDADVCLVNYSEYAKFQNCYSYGYLIYQADSAIEGSNNYYNNETALDSIYSDCSTSNTMTATGKTLAELQSPELLESMGYTRANGWKIENGVPLLLTPEEMNAGTGGAMIPAGAISLQIGINSKESSNITVNIGFALAGVDNLRGIGQDTTTDFLTQLDDMLATVNEKQVEYGSAQNRLESALDEISTQYENLVSSRSTLRDADIAEVSAEYIQQQILQQAAATLMSTANQSPAIALQLI